VLIFAHAGSLPRRFRFPKPEAIASLPWRLFIDTSRSAPDDIFREGAGPLADTSQPLELAERSLVCFVAEPEMLPARKGIAFSPG
jgi:hypothetical protein